MGTYVQIITPGTGAKVDTGMLVNANYTGMTLDGKVFDSNTDPSKGPTQPLTVNLTSDPSYGGIITGWKDALPLMNIGGKARIFIPSPLAYGDRGNPPVIQPNQILMFDVEVTERVTKEVAMKKLMDQQRQMQQAQEEMIKQMRKNGDTTLQPAN